jgi:predicted 3-demethylubiquinone-9 3-methyltransferase (glyoxalase superfamily)
MAKITTFLSYQDQAEAAVELYVSIFDGKILSTMGGGEGPLGEKGKVFSLTFELFGQPFMAMNGGRSFQFSDGVSLFVSCETQAEIDRYWARLTEGGGKEVQCGWLVDRFGVSWQIVPEMLGRVLGGPDPVKSQRALQAMLKMKKLDIATLQRAYDGA